MGHPAAGKEQTPVNGNYSVRIPRRGPPGLAAVGGRLKGSVPPSPPQTTLINKYKGNAFPREPASFAWPLTSLSGHFLQPQACISALAHRGLRTAEAAGGAHRAPGGPSPAAQDDARPCGRAELLPEGCAELRRARDSPPGHMELTGSRCAPSSACTLLT